MDKAAPLQLALGYDIPSLELLSGTAETLRDGTLVMGFGSSRGIVGPKPLPLPVFPSCTQL